MKYIYLHGFASSPQSFKAQFLKKRLAEVGINLFVPDLNLGDFTSLKISRQAIYLNEIIAAQNDEYCVIGSSLGGLLALILAEEIQAIKKLILLAPAIEIKDIWNKELGNEGVKLWHEAGFYNIYHSGARCEIPLCYSFIEDMNNIKDRGFKRNLPVLLIHGENDKTIPINVSYRYQEQNKFANLIKLDCGHGMEDKVDDIWDSIYNFITYEEETENAY